jgi:hypothetical protein
MCAALAATAFVFLAADVQARGFRRRIVKPVEIESGGWGGHSESRYYLIQSEREFEDIWPAFIYPKPQLPEVDFNRFSVAVVALGAQPTCGYQIHIKRVRISRLRKRVARVLVHIHEPTGLQLCFANAPYLGNSPFSVVKIPKVRKAYFRTRECAGDCRDDP